MNNIAYRRKEFNVKVERSSKLIQVQEEKERNETQNRYEQTRFKAGLHLKHTVGMRDKYPSDIQGHLNVILKSAQQSL